MNYLILKKLVKKILLASSIPQIFNCFLKSLIFGLKMLQRFAKLACFLTLVRQVGTLQFKL
jgi:hypothetical protein